MMAARRILLVEDNAGDEAMTLRALRKSNIEYEVSIARDGAETLRKLFEDDMNGTPPALVLLDLMLPKISGFEVLRRIRADQRTRLIPVVVLTSSGQKEDILAAYRGGTNAYVQKPVAFAEYAEAVRALGEFWLQLSKPPPEEVPGRGRTVG
jgi:two-component system response regulator